MTTKAVEVKEIISQLTLEEKLALRSKLLGNRPIPRLDVPSLKVSDGPNGARGGTMFGGVTAACFPASVALASTWDPALVHQIGNALAEETKTKGAMVLLGPTVCPHRSPLGGRNFESFSEDPFLAGTLATHYINGLQERGVGATIKHFVANESETKRFSMNVNVSQRALREIYLKPFEIAIKGANPWAVMTSYNLINGLHADMCTTNLRSILRGDWGWKGLVMSDWGGCNSTIESIEAGLDLEMPGPTMRRKPEAVISAVKSNKLTEQTIDERVAAVLDLLVKTGKFDNPTTPPEQAIDRPEHRKLIREAGAQGIVLLKNEDNILPLNKDDGSIKSIAVLGLAKQCLAHGGGSAMVNCHYKISPYDALETAFDGKIKIEYAKGAQDWRNLPTIVDEIFDIHGKPGVTISRFNTTDITSEPEFTMHHPMTSYAPFENKCAAFTLRATFKPSLSGKHHISLSSLGHSELSINGESVIEISKDCDDPMGYLLGGSLEERVTYDFAAGKEYQIFCKTFVPETTVTDGLSLLEGVSGLAIGFMAQQEYDEDLISEAVEAAKSADVALVFVGRSNAWETEGQDLADMALPARGSQDTLISAVSIANPRTIVINSTGTPISMPWLPNVPAVVQAWFGGQEAGNSICDVLFGKVNPGGKLPVSFPKSFRDSPVYGNWPGDVQTLQVDYGEGVYVGYRHFDKHPGGVLFPFGHGLSYTTFDLSPFPLEKPELVRGTTVNVVVRVKNTGDTPGHEVVQAYISKPKTLIDVPEKELGGFVKVWLEPGESKEVDVWIDYQTAASWSEERSCWVVGEGEYKVWVGNSSATTVEAGVFVVKETFRFSA